MAKQTRREPVTGYKTTPMQDKPNLSREQGIPDSSAAKRAVATAGRAALCPSCRAGYMQVKTLNDIDVARMCDDCGYVSDSR